MNHRLPPDIDRMLWEIAESQDSNAYDDFGARFPQLVGELGKRIQLVRELRDAGGSTRAIRPVPSFDRRMPTHIGPSARLVWSIGGVTVAALGLAAFVVTNRVMNRPIPTPPPHVQTAPPKLPDQGATNAPNNSAPEPSPKPQTPQANIVAVEQPPPVAPYDKPQALVTFARTKLQSAILAVAASGGLVVEFAPNMPNPEIRMEYRNMSALNILKDLGPRFRFTPFTEGGNKVLIVPELDRNAPTLPPASGYATDLNTEIGADDSGPIKPKKVRGNSQPAPS